MLSGEGPRPNFEVPAASLSFLRGDLLLRPRSQPIVSSGVASALAPVDSLVATLASRQQLGLRRPIRNAFVRGSGSDAGWCGGDRCSGRVPIKLTL